MRYPTLCAISLISFLLLCTSWACLLAWLDDLCTIQTCKIGVSSFPTFLAVFARWVGWFVLLCGPGKPAHVVCWNCDVGGPVLAWTATTARNFVLAFGLLFTLYFVFSGSHPMADTKIKGKGKGKEKEKPQQKTQDNGPADTAETSNVPTIPTSSTRLPFTSLPLSPPTQRALASMKLTHTTPIQTACIPLLLASGTSDSNQSSGALLPTTTPDILAAARTGSGKTLAFLLPAIELLHRLKFKPHNGTGVIIISPTRELALQIFGVVREVMSGGEGGKGFSQTFGILMGGANRRAEEEKLVKGVNLVVATPGRLWDHLRVCISVFDHRRNTKFIRSRTRRVS